MSIVLVTGTIKRVHSSSDITFNVRPRHSLTTFAILYPLVVREIYLLDEKLVLFEVQGTVVIDHSILQVLSEVHVFDHWCTFCCEIVLKSKLRHKFDGHLLQFLFDNLHGAFVVKVHSTPDGLVDFKLELL